MRNFLLLSCLLTFGSLAGCGTMRSLTDEDAQRICTLSAKLDDKPAERLPRIYSGVAYDVWAMKIGGHGHLMFFDVPFSLVTDTVVLPYTAYSQIAKGSRICPKES